MSDEQQPAPLLPPSDPSTRSMNEGRNTYGQYNRVVVAGSANPARPTAAAGPTAGEPAAKPTIVASKPSTPAPPPKK